MKSQYIIYACKLLHRGKHARERLPDFEDWFERTLVGNWGRSGGEIKHGFSLSPCDKSGEMTNSFMLPTISSNFVHLFSLLSHLSHRVRRSPGCNRISRIQSGCQKGTGFDSIRFTGVPLSVRASSYQMHLYEGHYYHRTVGLCSFTELFFRSHAYDLSWNSRRE